MPTLSRLAPLWLALALCAAPANASGPAAAPPAATAPGTAPPPDGETLHDTIAALDDRVFAAFNACSDPARLREHAAFFAPDVEFYHDTGGVTWTREAMLANTARHVCGRFRRERVPGTLAVFPIKDFGAIARGSHRFCRFDGDRCEGEADFTIVWRLRDGQWAITRVLSYGHRPAP